VSRPTSATRSYKKHIYQIDWDGMSSRGIPMQAAWWSRGADDRDPNRFLGHSQPRRRAENGPEEHEKVDKGGEAKRGTKYAVACPERVISY